MSESIFIFLSYIKETNLTTEVVLIALLEAFCFSQSKKEIFWQMNAIVNPIVIGRSDEPQLPLIVSAI